MELILPQKVKLIIDTLKESGYKAYAVGGCVRDSILGRNINDWDICTSARPEDTINVFEEKYTVVPTGLKHGTVTVVIEKEQFEITTFRIDGEYKDNRRPESVKYTEEVTNDLSRRDFTINAMAYDEKEGIIDPFNGKADLEALIVRCVGEAMLRFEEDALRMLRAIRFACQMGCQIETDTFEAIKKNAESIRKISKERIRDELCKILVSKNPAEGIKMLQKTGLLEIILPELSACIGFEQHSKYHDKDVYKHTLSVLEKVQPKLELRLSALFHDLGKPICFSRDEMGQGHFYGHEKLSEELTIEIMKRYKFDNVIINHVCILVREHMLVLQQVNAMKAKKLLNRIGTDYVTDLLELRRADILSMNSEVAEVEKIDDFQTLCEEIIRLKAPFEIKDLQINGKDILAKGVKEGREIGRVLDELLEAVIEKPDLNTRESLLKLADDILSS